MPKPAFLRKPLLTLTEEELKQYNEYTRKKIAKNPSPMWELLETHKTLVEAQRRVNYLKKKYGRKGDDIYASKIPGGPYFEPYGVWGRWGKKWEKK